MVLRRGVSGDVASQQHHFLFFLGVTSKRLSTGVRSGTGYVTRKVKERLRITDPW